MEATPPRYQAIECKTIDSTVISGWLYTVEGPAPAIIMSHGFNCVKSMTLPDVAEAFQSLGYNVLLYDGRSVGESGGHLSNLIDPLQMAEDLSDIYTYVAGLPSVDAQKIALWGISFGAVISACAAAIDRRPKALVMVCPLFSYVQPHRAERAYATLIKDRVSQLCGNQPYSLPVFTPRGENPLGMGGSGATGGLEAYNLMKQAAEAENPHFRDRVMFQTYHKLAMFRPKEYMDMIRTPVLMVIPELDNISPPQEQREAFARIQSPKTEYCAKDKGHLNILTGEKSKELVTTMAEFLRVILEGSIGPPIDE